MQMIKREESPEPTIATIAPAVSSSIIRFPHARNERITSEEEDVKPSVLPPEVAMPRSATRQAPFTSNVYRGTSPRKYEFDARGPGAKSASGHSAPFSQFPSCFVAGMATGCQQGDGGDNKFRWRYRNDFAKHRSHRATSHTPRQHSRAGLAQTWARSIRTTLTSSMN
jgi:hypothetical protein